MRKRPFKHLRREMRAKGVYTLDIYTSMRIEHVMVISMFLVLDGTVVLVNTLTELLEKRMSLK